MSPAGRRTVARLARDACLLAAAGAFLLPFYVVVVTAVKPLAEVLAGSMLALPAEWTAAPLRRVWSQACIAAACDGLAGGFWTSTRIAVPATTVSVLLGAVNGYALTQWRLPGAHALFGLLLAANLLPYQMVLVPLAVTLRTLGLFGTVEGLVLVHVAYGMPYTTLLFRNFYLGLHPEVVGAARLDGAGFWRTFRHVVLPLSRPMLAIAAVLQFAAIWNDYLFGLVFGGRQPPVTVLLNNLANGEAGAKEPNVALAGVLLTALPPLVLYVASGRWLMRGLAGLPDPR